MDYTAKRKYIRHKWRGKTFSVFDKDSFFLDTMALGLAQEVDRDVIIELVRRAKEMGA